MVRPSAARAPWPTATLLFWGVVALLLVVPVQMGLAYLHAGGFIWRGLLASLGLVGLLVALSALAPRARLAWGTVVGILVIALFFLRMLFFGLTRFSGRAFDAGFFLSLQGESVDVAWNQYFYLFALFGLGALVLLAGFIFAARWLRTPRPLAAGILALLSLAAIAAGYRTTPVWQLASAVQHWYAPKVLTLPPSRLAMWKQSPLININLVPKQALHATAASPPKNLILLYIESGGVAMAPARQYPGLMRNMQRLIAEHGYVPHIHASSYVTIEGLVNTQCGTLFPFAQGSDSMAGFDHMLDEMPCLGDVLAAAGYRQSYLGGSGKSFAGKGRFLELHGYDKVMGIRDWAKQGLYQRPDTWGLSDADLFKQSFAELKRLKASGHPWNLTLLTIGSHLPGFFYKECTPYGDGSKRFLNAVHCSDELIGRWVAKLKADGWLDNAILVITGDHQIFPNPLMKQLFGDEAVADHRLPFVVIGHDLPQPKQHDGAGFDIAPTLLDLLGVRSNARFALGRSLLRDDRSLPYYPSRYIDILGEQRYGAGDDFHCDPGNTTRIPGAQPPSRCERAELDTILEGQAAAYSAPPPQMRCNAAEPLLVRVPTAAGAPLEVRLTGSEQAGRFTWSERHVTPEKPGLYLLTLDAQGKLLDRQYAPPDAIAKTFAEQPEFAGAALLLVWRPGDGKPPVALPGWVRALGAGDGGGAWLFALPGTAAPALVEHVPRGQTLSLPPQRCRDLLAGP
ncbi:MAG TPA: LTA synthase family protein [Rhodanobacteraceae bacterium]|nr:LTA synthase family protein [Rhodanobacteraceae bacterium]